MYKKIIYTITTLIFILTSLPTPAYSISTQECTEKIAPYVPKLENLNDRILVIAKDKEANVEVNKVILTAKVLSIALELIWIVFRLYLLPDECQNVTMDALDDAMQTSSDFMDSHNQPTLPTGPMPVVCEKYIEALHDHITLQITEETIMSDNYIEQGPNPLLAKHNDSYGYTQDFWSAAIAGSTPYECIPFINVETIRLNEHSKEQSKKLRPYKPEWSSCK